MPKERLSDPINARSMFAKGESFLFTARFLQRSGVPVLGASWCAWPTSLAFACEAYLKVLAQLERGEPPFETHNLRELFHDLLPATQRELRCRWLKRDGSSLKRPPIALPVKLKQPKTFEEALDLSAKAFVDWRYNDARANHWHMGSLPEILREHILTLQPDWKPPPGVSASILNPHPDFVRPRSQVVSVLPAGWAVFDHKTPTVDIEIGRGSDPKDRGPDKRG